VLSSIPDLIYVFDLNHRFVYANNALLRLWGKTWDQAIGKNCLELGYEPGQAAMHDREIEQVIAAKQPVRGEVPFTGTNGRRIYDYVFVPIIGPDGQVEAVAGTTRDVTDRKRSEMATGRLAAIVESSEDAIVSKNLESVITSWNQSAERLFGYTASEAIGKSITLIIPPDRQNEEDQIIERIRRGERIEHFETERVRKDGTRVPLSLTISPVKDAAGNVIGASKIARDITERRESQRALQESEQRLRKVERIAAAGQLAASLAHEINNPLASVTNALYLLNSSQELSGDAKVLVKTAERELARVSRIVRQSLSYYRVNATPKDVDLSAILEESLLIFNERIQRAGIQLINRITTGMRIMGFADEIRQVIDNLLLNALEATPQAGRLAVSVHRSQNWKTGRSGVRLSIADSGCGMPKEHLSHVFEPFFTTKPEKGTGLGLWVVQGIVTKHEGKIIVRTTQRPGRSGTVVSILWPTIGHRQQTGAVANRQGLL
jgi:PAS domain S-box-containing protein